MVIQVFPIAKLAALLLKQISKPIANAAQSKAKSSPIFRKYICLPPARFYNWCEVKVKMWILNLGMPVNITVLNEASAVELGANLLSEAVIFVIAAGLLLAEVQRSSGKEAAKEQEKNMVYDELQHTIRELYFKTEQQGTLIRELHRKLYDIEHSVVHKPWVPKIDIPPPEDPPEQPPPVPLTKSNIDITKLNIQNMTNEKHELEIKLLDKYQYEDIYEGLVFTAINDIQNNFLLDPNPKRSSGVLTVALNNLCKDVYRIPVQF